MYRFLCYTKDSGGAAMKHEISCGIILTKYYQNKRHFLLVKQSNTEHYGFPKGHAEAGESKRETALREVKEETNIDTFIIGKYYQKVSYSPKVDVLKDVYYFLGKPLSDELIHQDGEILHVTWVEQNEVEQYLRFDNDKELLKYAVKKFNEIERGIPNNLIEYIEINILPMYKSLDKAHGLDHVYHVIFEALKLTKTFKDVDPKLVYTIAAFHDLGLLDGRDKHHITGGIRLKQDQMIQSLFKQQEIEVMVNAVFDHRASNDHEPRTIYGKIIAEADRDMNANKIIYRTALYESSKHPDLTIDEKVENCYQHMLEKYSEKGYMKLYLEIGKNVSELKKLRKTISNEAKIRLIFKDLVSKIQ